MQQVPHWSLDQHEPRHEPTKIIHEATEGVAATKVKPRKPYVTDAILEVFAHRARLIQIKHKDEKQVKLFDRKRVFAIWREVTYWIAGHKRPTHVSFDTFGDFQSRINSIKHGFHAYQSLWARALQASAKAGKAEVALRRYQRIQRSNLKEAMRAYLDDFEKQAAVVSVDWWDKL